jgi:peptide/nickel transport system permease protein
MLGRLVPRVAYAVVSLLALLVIVFSLVRLTGDPTFFLLPPDASAKQVQDLREELGLDKPIPVQFATYVGDLAQGDLGMSFRSRVPVTDLIEQRLPATLTMGLGAMFLVLAVGIPLGIYSAYWQGSLLDKFARGISALGQSVPDFWFGLLLVLLLAVWLGWLPSGGYGGLKHLVLPSLTLAFQATAGLVRLLRSSTLEALGSDYVKFLRIKGTVESQVLWKHVLRNAGLTALSFAGIIMVSLFTGSVLVETVFVWPGIGRLLVESIGTRDFNVVQGVILLMGAAYIVMNLLIDLAYLVLNPRLRFSGQGR